MLVLALNPGSSSLRFQIVLVERQGVEFQARRLAGGSIAALGEHATARTRVGEADHTILPVSVGDHTQALDWLLTWLASQGFSFEAVGVRVVQGFSGAEAAARADSKLLAALRAASAWAPLHNRPALALVERLQGRPEGAVPLAAVFDSAFHAGLPLVARTYALPADLCERTGIRRVGFHGIALRSVVESLRASVGLPSRLVVAHLGSGCSITALQDGRSIDTTMGFTPLEGLVMSTRCGSLDPALVAVIARTERCSAEDVVDLLSRRSGLLGVSCASGDLRAIERLRASGDARATLAFDLFVHHARKHLAAMIAVLHGCDAVAFSGGIGENSSAVRAAILAGMEWCGLVLDARLNRVAARGERISPADSAVAVHVVGVDEESWIARATCEVLEHE